MRNLLFVLISMLFFFSCKEEEIRIIHYKLNGVSVSRVDVEKKTYLYYGDCNNAEFIKKKASLLIDWQFDDFLQASLIFHENGRVEIMSGGGGKLKMTSKKNEIYFREYESPEFNEIMDRYTAPNDLNNLCYIGDNTKFELQENKKFRSKVLIIDELQNDKSNCL